MNSGELNAVRNSAGIAGRSVTATIMQSQSICSFDFAFWQNMRTMHLSFRQAKEKDFPWCFSILKDGFENKPDLQSQLPAIWGNLLREDAITMVVLEDKDRGSGLVAFGATVFISDRAAEQVLAEPKPHLAVAILERELKRRGRLILRAPDIRRNSAREGLNLLVLHYSEVLDGYNEEEFLVIRDTMVFGLLETHRRNRLKLLLYEFYGEQDLPFMEDSGVRVVSDFKDWYEARGLALPYGQERPYLVAADKQTTKKRPAAWLSWLFFSPPSRIGLTPAEQKIALRALAGETDAELSQNPMISSNTVRRHWRSIYKRFTEAKINLIPPELLDGEREHLSSNGDPIMKKKRPFLLNYLRQHPEELRPHAARPEQVE
jgi:hypothetical protein